MSIDFFNFENFVFFRILNRRKGTEYEDDADEHTSTQTFIMRMLDDRQPYKHPKNLSLKYIWITKLDTKRCKRPYKYPKHSLGISNDDVDDRTNT